MKSTKLKNFVVVTVLICLAIALAYAAGCLTPLDPRVAGGQPSQMRQGGPGEGASALQDLAAALDLTKKAGVIVLGSYAGQEIQALNEVRERLRGKGYHAEFIKDLPEIGMMTNEEKVRIYTLSSRFVVMVDRSPSGHIAEYLIMREQRSIMALLRPVRSGSTWMIGDDPWVDVNFIKLFGFEQSPVSVLDSAIEWAEGMVQKRTDAYNKGYPWRKK